MLILGTLFFLCAASLVTVGQGSRLPVSSPQIHSGDDPGGEIWLDVPFFPQQKNGCGASSLAMVLQYWKSDPAVDPESIFSLLYSDKLKGIPASRMKAFLEEKGFRAFTFSATLSDLKRHLLKGRPLIVSLGAPSLHYLVVVGLDERQNLILVNDPAVKKLSRMDRDEFLKAWKRTRYWTLLAVPNVHR